MPDAATSADSDAGRHVPGKGSWLLLHGTPLAGCIWHEVADKLGRRDTNSPDLLPRPVPGSLLQARCAHGLAQELIGSGRPVDVVGHSFGGQVAVELALAAPAQVRSLVILCSRDTAFPCFAAAAEAIRTASGLDIDGTLGRWFRPDELAADGTAVRLARQCLLMADRRAYAAALDAISTWQAASERLRLKLPVTLIAAEHDPVSSPAVMREWADGLRNARYVELPGAAHMSAFTRPRELANVLRQHRELLADTAAGAE